MPDLDPGKAEKSNAGSGGVSGDSSEGNDKDGEALAAEVIAETAAETIAETAAEAIAETAVERPAVITEAAEMTKMKDRFRIFVKLDTRSGNRIVFRFVGKCADPFAGRGRKLPVYT